MSPLLLFFAAVAVFGGVYADSEDQDSICYDALNACYQEHIAPLFSGEHETYEEYIQQIKDTPLSVQCRHRTAQVDCLRPLFGPDGPSCPSHVKEWFDAAQFVVQFRCVDNVEDLSEAWRCLMEVNFHGDSNGCFWNTTCGAEEFSHCFEIEADSVANTEACAAPGKIEKVKSVTRKFFHALAEKDLLCPSDKKKLKKMLYF